MILQKRVLTALALEEPDRTPAMMYWNLVVSERFGSPEELILLANSRGMKSCD